MGLWRVGSVDDEPITELYEWKIVKIHFDDGIEYHFIGSVGYEGRVSSKIINFDKETMSGITRSGRKYKLCGASSELSSNASYVWSQWSYINKVPSDDNKLEDFSNRIEEIDL